MRKELGTYGTMLNSTDQEKFMKGLEQQRAGNQRTAGEKCRTGSKRSKQAQSLYRAKP
ncbi:MAG: hypothetical protein ACLSFF_02995 [Roseburia intestinalis]